MGIDNSPLVMCINHPEEPAIFDKPQNWCDDCYLKWFNQAQEEDNGDLGNEAAQTSIN